MKIMRTVVLLGVLSLVAADDEEARIAMENEHLATNAKAPGVTVTASGPQPTLRACATTRARC